METDIFYLSLPQWRLLERLFFSFVVVVFGLVLAYRMYRSVNIEIEASGYKVRIAKLSGSVFLFVGLIGYSWVSFSNPMTLEFKKTTTGAGESEEELVKFVGIGAGVEIVPIYQELFLLKSQEVSQLTLSMSESSQLLELAIKIHSRRRVDPQFEPNLFDGNLTINQIRRKVKDAS